VTLFMTLLAAFHVLLARYSRQEQIVVGSPIANRNRSEIEGLIGFFVNMLVLRADLSGNPSFLTLLHQVKGVALGAYAHQDLPFEKLVEELQPERTLSHNPLFQATLGLQNIPRPVTAPPAGHTGESSVGLDGMDYETTATKFDLEIYLWDQANGLSGRTYYSRDLFEETTIKRLMGHYLNVLRGIVERERPISDLSLLSVQEREQIVVGWNQTGRPYPQDRLIHELFERQLDNTPESIALIYEDRRLSYAELNAKANQLAHYLQRLGIGPESLVGVCAERSLEMVIGLLAVLKAGGAYVPLDPTYPAERLAYMLEDSAPIVVLTHTRVRAEIRSALAQAGVPMIDLEADTWRWANETDVNRDESAVELTPEHLAYVIYTSGSTGRPKGVMNEHRGVVNRLLWMQDAYGLTEDDAVLQKTPFGFDVSVWEFFWPLLNGARLVMARPEGHKDPAYLASAIEQERITTLHFVPSMLQVFLESGEAARCSSLVRVICSGESLSGSSVRRFRQQLTTARLYNLYGPTEAAVDVTAWDCAAEVCQENIPIGRPIANTQIYLLDDNGEPAPVGVSGEIHIGGVQVGRGYLNRPELTAERFVACPFGVERNTRMYKTGDLGRYLPDGNIEFLGRNDFQVKIRGFRIELGEIEARLAQHPAIKEAVVLTSEDSAGDLRLVGYYTQRRAEASAIKVDAEELRAHLLTALPEYMAPAAYIALEALPLTPNGKLDRRALPAPDSAAYTSHEYEAPVGAIETALARIWAEALGLERVGRFDNFFKLGGHSLLAIRLFERMRREGLHADVRAIFATPTLAALASAVGGESGVIDVPPNGIPPGCEAITPEMLPLVEMSAAEIELIVSAVPGGAANVQDVYPLAPLQEGILFHHLTGGEGDVYLMSVLLAFDSRGRLERFLRALQAVIDRHDILRTAVLWEGLPEPVQVVWRQASLEIEEVSLDPAMGETAEQLLARFNPRRYRLDIRRAPLMCTRIAHDASNARWVMLHLFHHLAIDHAALEVLLEESGTTARAAAVPEFCGAGEVGSEPARARKLLPPDVG
jgi:arthrofactin-type cyclic lipopeptide synthetase C